MNKTHRPAILVSIVLASLSWGLVSCRNIQESLTWE
jgi:hypothetical protein